MDHVYMPFRGWIGRTKYWSTFDQGMVGTRLTSLSVSRTATLLGISHSVSRVCEEWSTTQRTSSQWQSSGWHELCRATDGLQLYSIDRPVKHLCPKNAQLVESWHKWGMAADNLTEYHFFQQKTCCSGLRKHCTQEIWKNVWSDDSRFLAISRWLED